MHHTPASATSRGGGGSWPGARGGAGPGTGEALGGWHGGGPRGGSFRSRRSAGAGRREAPGVGPSRPVHPRSRGQRAALGPGLLGHGEPQGSGGRGLGRGPKAAGCPPRAHRRRRCTGPACSWHWSHCELGQNVVRGRGLPRLPAAPPAEGIPRARGGCAGWERGRGRWARARVLLLAQLGCGGCGAGETGVLRRAGRCPAYGDPAAPCALLPWPGAAPARSPSIYRKCKYSV